MAGPSGALFTSREYLEPLEGSGCVSPESGWTPVPIRLPGGAWAPCYGKSHSWGEFVFDFELAAAYRDQGLRYYPKLVCCVPFTPVPGPRLLATDAQGRKDLAAALIERTREGYSSTHVLFATEEEAALLRSAGWATRLQLRYGWTNAGYADFDGFLSRLSSKRRKNIRRERKAVAASGLQISWQEGAGFSASEWTRIHALYASTYQVRGQPPYLNLQCLRAWAENFGSAMQFCLARREADIVAMAFFFRDEETLYGRHWGAAEAQSGLHFELCYYQGIEYCIHHRLARFDAGVQGEHRLLRGFGPEFTHSAHWFVHDGFRAAIERAFHRETSLLRAHVEQLRADEAG
jgi:uncharacterized protein